MSGHGVFTLLQLIQDRVSWLLERLYAESELQGFAAGTCSAAFLSLAEKKANLFRRLLIYAQATRCTLDRDLGCARC